jgi:hypothetical protein
MPGMTPAVPPQQFNNVPGPNGQPQQPSPGIGGAIMDAVRALAMALGPKALTGQAQREKVNEQQAEGQQAPAPLGQVLGQ